jgi:hypothetical protein
MYSWLVAAAFIGAFSSETSSYIRHLASQQIDYRYITSQHTNSSQVHLALGGENEMVVTFVSVDGNTESMVSYGATEGSFTHVRGNSASYSQLMEFSGQLYSPTMGAPFTTEEKLLALENTSSWAYDKKTGEHYANWNNPSSLSSAGSYNNPFTIYNSPTVHTVTLSGLKADLPYVYKVAGNDHLFDFTMPGGPALPMTIGLTADVGQTGGWAPSAVADRDPYIY